MPAQHSDVYQPSAMDDGIVYGSNPSVMSGMFSPLGGSNGLYNGGNN